MGLVGVLDGGLSLVGWASKQVTRFVFSRGLGMGLGLGLSRV